MTEKRLKLGRQGEEAAVAFLKKKGYRIIEKNFRCKLGEIDIIAEQGGPWYSLKSKPGPTINTVIPSMR